MTSLFLSHSSDDKQLVRQVMSELTLMGAAPFFDEVGVANGASIPGWIESALAVTDKFVIFWSSNSAESDWVKRELEAAQWAFKSEPERLLIVILDDTPRPPMLAPKKYIDGREGVDAVAQELLDLVRPAKMLMAIQQTLETWGIETTLIPGYGPIVGCPFCGADLRHIKASSEYIFDDEYVTVYCTNSPCTWSDTNEV
ncbi:toll/interleukin-1 receptor domain-containing protein [Arthrobacter sp. Rue61a]|uniref:toll/interleukin-1 receptor domain-containing protein n=1 Tax=Arthrobacter sp. Rue61a TaxID=1118963 RepID=UPI0005BD4FD4|nr:toll/interleukin-1 receptor domain-containing protein [Arthrobacter sp. Rue61a]